LYFGGKYERKYNRRLLSVPRKKNEIMSKTKLLNKTFWQRFRRVRLDVALTQVRGDTFFFCRTGALRNEFYRNKFQMAHFPSANVKNKAK